MASGRPAKLPSRTTQRSLGGRDEVHCLLVPEVDVVSQHARVQQLPHVFALVICCSSNQPQRRVRRRRSLGAGRPPAPARPLAPAFDRSPPGEQLPERTLVEVYFFLILPSSLSTRSFSCSLVEQFRISWM